MNTETKKSAHRRRRRARIACTHSTIGSRRETRRAAKYPVVSGQSRVEWIRSFRLNPATRVNAGCSSNDTNTTYLYVYNMHLFWALESFSPASERTCSRFWRRGTRFGRLKSLEQDFFERLRSASPNRAPVDIHNLMLHLIFAL